MQSAEQAAVTPAECVAGVLVGGQSRRMGSDKALLPWRAGETLLERVVRVAAEVAGEVCLLGDGAALPKRIADMTVLSDAVADAGPLAGLAALLSHARERWGLLLACDMPALHAPVLRRLLAAAGPDVEAVAYGAPGEEFFYESTCALYHPRATPQVLASLKSGERSLQGVLRGVRVARLEPTDEERARLTGVNTPEQLEWLRQAFNASH